MKWFFGVWPISGALVLSFWGNNKFRKYVGRNELERNIKWESSDRLSVGGAVWWTFCSARTPLIQRQLSLTCQQDVSPIATWICLRVWKPSSHSGKQEFFFCSLLSIRQRQLTQLNHSLFLQWVVQIESKKLNRIYFWIKFFECSILISLIDSKYN